MASTYKIVVYHGLIPGTQYNWPADGGVFHNADSSPSSITAAQPIPIPPAGQYRYSHRKNLLLWWLTPATGSIRNLRFWTGPEVVAQGTMMQAYPQQDYSQASSADLNNSILGGADVAIYTEASPLTLNPGVVHTGGTVGRGTQPFLIMQLRIDSTAASGGANERSMTWVWDET
jgi:hypothetical protein